MISVTESQAFFADMWVVDSEGAKSLLLVSLAGTSMLSDTTLAGAVFSNLRARASALAMPGSLPALCAASDCTKQLASPCESIG